MTKVKICGITNLEDALLSAKFGADALGFNFYEKSPRYILPEVAREIIDELPENILKVGVFVNEEQDKIIEIAKVVNLDAIQLHGEETPEFAKELKTKTGLEFIKAFRVSGDFKPEDVLQYEVDAILLDAYSPKEHGGTGGTFDWKIAFKVKQLVPKLYLAGGLDSGNVDVAVRRVQPFAVDSCSLLEKRKGKKDKKKVYKFISSLKKDKKFEIKNIYDLLLIIEFYPGMYLGMPTIDRLFMFLLGVEFGVEFESSGKSSFDWLNFNPNLKPRHAHGFQSWIAKKLLNRETSAYDWAKIILEHCNNNEEKAFDYFFDLLEEFKQENKDF